MPKEKPYWTLFEAVNWIASGKAVDRGPDIFTEDKPFGLKYERFDLAASALLEALRIGGFKVLGHRGENAKPEPAPIDDSFWKAAEFDYWDQGAEIEDIFAPDFEEYTRLLFQIDQIKNLWSKPMQWPKPSAPSRKGKGGSKGGRRNHREIEKALLWIEGQESFSDLEAMPRLDMYNTVADYLKSTPRFTIPKISTFNKHVREYIRKTATK